MFVLVDEYVVVGIVSGWYYWDWLLGNVDVEV